MCYNDLKPGDEFALDGPDFPKSFIFCAMKYDGQGSYVLAYDSLVDPEYQTWRIYEFYKYSVKIVEPRYLNPRWMLYGNNVRNNKSES